MSPKHLRRLRAYLQLSGVHCLLMKFLKCVPLDEDRKFQGCTISLEVFFLSFPTKRGVEGRQKWCSGLPRIYFWKLARVPMYVRAVTGRGGNLLKSVNKDIENEILQYDISDRLTMN